MKEHHDIFLCRRLAENVMGWPFLRLNTFGDPMYKTGDRLVDTRQFDPCCHSYHCHLLELRVAELDWEYEWTRGEAILMRDNRIVHHSGGVDRLDATARVCDLINEVSA